MSQADDRTLVLELLQPFRRALGPASAAHAPSPGAATHLNFDDTAEDAGFSKVKSNFDTNTTPVTKRPRNESEADPSPMVSPWQVKRFRVEALESRVQIDKLEKQISYQHVVRKEMEELFNNERQIFINERKSKDNAISDMEQKLRSMRTKESELREQLSKGVKEFNDYKHLSEKERLSIQNEIFDLKNDLANSKISSNEQLSKLKKDIVELTKNYEISQKEVIKYQSALEEVDSDSQQLITLQETFDRQTVALQQAEIRLREFETSKKDLEEIKVLQKRLISMPALEKEVVRLREEATELRAAARQNLLLEEQVQFYKSRMESLEPLYQNYCDLQKSHIETERILDEWKRVGDTYESPKPQSLVQQIEKYQQREITLLSEQKDADMLLSATKSELMNLKCEHKKVSSKFMDAQNFQKTQESFIHRLQKKLLLVSRERDSYRQQLDCYEKELTMNIGPESQLSLGTTNNRIEGLEKSLQGYKDLVAKLEEDIASLRGTSTQQEQLSRLRDEVINLTKENEILRLHSDKVDIQLERSVCGIDQKQPGTKILHMVQNPLSNAQEDMQNILKKAQAEIAQLKYRIKLLKDNELEITQKLNETIQHSGPTTEEYSQLKEQLESNKKKSQRIKEVCTSSLQDYRDVFYMLIGYKIDRISVNNYRLSSMYADSPNQYLRFKVSDSGIEMVQTDYSASVSDLVDEHLHQHRSVPVFLSELTLDLFKKRSMISDSIMQ